MDKILEDYLWNEISYVNDSIWNSQYNRFPRDVIDEMLKNGWIKSPKQAHATLDKWIRKGVYDYGCSLDLGWKCEKTTNT
jgi:hypothetical protein